MRDGQIVVGVDPAAGKESIVVGSYNRGFLTVHPLSEAEQFLADAGLQDTGPCCDLSAWHTANCPPFEEATVQVAPVEG